MSWAYDETFDIHVSTKESEFDVFLQHFQNTSQIIYYSINRSLSIAHMPNFEKDRQMNEITKAHFCSLV